MSWCGRVGDDGKHGDLKSGARAIVTWAYFVKAEKWSVATDLPKYMEKVSPQALVNHASAGYVLLHTTEGVAVGKGLLTTNAS